MPILAEATAIRLRQSVITSACHALRPLFALRRPGARAASPRRIVVLRRCCLGDVLMTQHRYTDAAAQYHAVISRQPNRADWQLRLGTALAETGDLEPAAEHFRAALTLDPANELARASLNRAVDLLEGR